MEIAIFWLAFAIIVAIAAERRYGRNGVGWFFIALFISPLLAILLLFALGPLPMITIAGRAAASKSSFWHWFMHEM